MSDLNKKKKISLTQYKCTEGANEIGCVVVVEREDERDGLFRTGGMCYRHMNVTKHRLTIPQLLVLTSDS